MQLWQWFRYQFMIKTWSQHWYLDITYLIPISLMQSCPFMIIDWSWLPSVTSKTAKAMLDKFNICVHWFSCTENGSACTFVHTKLYMHKIVTMGANLHCLIYNLLIVMILCFSPFVTVCNRHILLSVNFKKYQLRICSTQTEYQQVN